MAIILAVLMATVLALAKAEPQVRIPVNQGALGASLESFATLGNVLPQSVLNNNQNSILTGLLNPGTVNNNNNLGAANNNNLGAVNNNFFNGAVSGNPRCRRNEVFLPCGPGCTQTCGNFLQTTTCTAPCRPGCFCLGSLVRDEWNRGLCVRPSRCRALRQRRPNRRDRSSSEEHRHRKRGDRND